MEVDLVRVHTPDDIGLEQNCGICAAPYRVEAVIALARTEHGTDIGPVCVECIDALVNGWRRFEHLHRYAEMLENPAPIWSSIEEATRAWEAGTDYALVRANMVRRAKPKVR